ncbi:hypothetical protein GMLC_19490 [Geomonas limicola]|uniref:Surface-adhesin protein E-like domain-containing protein n=1 Tax=Geomonas limicola TaxID=2740186 RepID=A0A6V8N7L1_9BACT|nr:surface-adhesin E family protein [Geomonas limicola]GFO68370.1 hypothetical protein GMLC_19490 [Geomonas limicola]
MAARIALAALLLVFWCGVSQGAERWSNFAEDQELKYYLDEKSIIALPDNVYIFWVKSVAKDRDYFRREYNQNNVSYMFTSYELDCAVSSYRVRGTILFDKNRREVSKVVPEREPAFEPVPPESVLELAQDEICQDRGEQEEEPEHAALPSEATPAEPSMAPLVTGAPAAPAAPEEPASPAAPAVPAAPAAPQVPAVPLQPEEPPSLQ